MFTRRLLGFLVVAMAILVGGDAPAAGKPKAKARPTAPVRKHPGQLAKANLEALGGAVRDLTRTFPKRYAKGPQYLKRLGEIEKQLAAGKRTPELAKRFEALRREALLANPLLDFETLLLIQRKPVGGARRPKGTGRGLGEYIGLPRQSSWQLDNLPNLRKWDNRLAALSPVRPDGKLTTVYQPTGKKLLSDIDLHWDADRLLFSMPDDKGRLQIFQIPLARGVTRKARQISSSRDPNVHNFDPCYLPNGRIAYVSTAPLQGVPCNAAVSVAMAYVMDADGRNVRQLCFDQDHNYCPTVANDGQILYLRWEYTDLPHVWGRYLFTMGLDGTIQREHYGSGSYWPNGIFYARAIPGHPTKVVGVVTGHHVGRVGELVIFDPSLGRYATDGVVQRILGRGRQVLPLIQDKLTEHSWPKFLHPWPLSDKYFIVSAKPTPGDLWGIYLVDVFDNMLLLKEVEGSVLVEPMALGRRPRPPVNAPRTNHRRDDALVYIEDVYTGPGLAGVPRGAVKELRLFTYYFVYQKMAGINSHVGVDGPWEPKRVLGTVPVASDGSALFRVPANTPISIQPLDSNGAALQLMRSWLTAMPGEIVACTGCHEKQNSAPPNRRVLATRRDPEEIRPWHGPVRPFSFAREVQPVLDRHCVACHDGKEDKPAPDLRADQGKYIVFRNRDPKEKVVPAGAKEPLFRKYNGIYPPAFVELRRYVRVGGYESDIRLLDPGEFHANTSDLMQILRKGHHGVRLDSEAWRRLATWIDLNAPCHGTWREAAGLAKIRNYHARRRKLKKLYAGINEDPASYPEVAAERVRPVNPAPTPRPPAAKVNCPGWPFDTAQAAARQAARPKHKMGLDLGANVKMDLAWIPPGEFVMGSARGHPDELPLTQVSLAGGFWIGTFEVTNEQYGRFDPAHDSRFEHKGSWSFSEKHLGWLLNRPSQPVVRVSWKDATAFCRWLSDKTGRKVTLPTEAQWEYACRAGTDTPLFYGDADTDFSAVANMADVTIRNLAYDTDGRYTADIAPRDRRFNDRALVTANVGSYKRNAWGLHDVHGNVWEWTRSAYRPYPYKAGDGRNDPAAAGERVARGGSWRDLPKRCRSAYRLSYPRWQKVFNVGFRVVIEDK